MFFAGRLGARLYLTHFWVFLIISEFPKILSLTRLFIYLFIYLFGYLFIFLSHLLSLLFLTFVLPIYHFH